MPSEHFATMNSHEKLSTLRGRAIELGFFINTMIAADSLESYDRALAAACQRIEQIQERLDLLEPSELGYEKVGEDSWHRRNQ